MTPNAVSRLKELQVDGNKILKIGTKKKGCSGQSYTLDYVTEFKKFDEVVEQDGVKVVIDSKALFTIIGSEMDFVKDELSSQFVFNNPNVKEVNAIFLEGFVLRWARNTNDSISTLHLTNATSNTISKQIQLPYEIKQLALINQAKIVLISNNSLALTYTLQSLERVSFESFFFNYEKENFTFPFDNPFKYNVLENSLINPKVARDTPVHGSFLYLNATLNSSQNRPCVLHYIFDEFNTLTQSCKAFSGITEANPLLDLLYLPSDDNNTATKFLLPTSKNAYQVEIDDNYIPNSFFNLTFTTNTKLYYASNNSVIFSSNSDCGLLRTVGSNTTVWHDVNRGGEVLGVTERGFYMCSNATTFLYLLTENGTSLDLSSKFEVKNCISQILYIDNDNLALITPTNITLLYTNFSSTNHFPTFDTLWSKKLTNSSFSTISQGNPAFYKNDKDINFYFNNGDLVTGPFLRLNSFETPDTTETSVPPSSSERKNITQVSTGLAIPITLLIIFTLIFCCVQRYSKRKNKSENDTVLPKTSGFIVLCCYVFIVIFFFFLGTATPTPDFDISGSTKISSDRAYSPTFEPSDVDITSNSLKKNASNETVSIAVMLSNSQINLPDSEITAKKNDQKETLNSNIKSTSSDIFSNVESNVTTLVNDNKLGNDKDLTTSKTVVQGMMLVENHNSADVGNLEYSNLKNEVDKLNLKNDLTGSNGEIVKKNNNHDADKTQINHTRDSLEFKEPLEFNNQRNSTTSSQLQQILTKNRPTSPLSYNSSRGYEASFEGGSSFHDSVSVSETSNRNSVDNFSLNSNNTIRPDDAVLINNYFEKNFSELPKEKGLQSLFIGEKKAEETSYETANSESSHYQKPTTSKPSVYDLSSDNLNSLSNDLHIDHSDISSEVVNMHKYQEMSSQNGSSASEIKSRILKQVVNSDIDVQQSSGELFLTADESSMKKDYSANDSSAYVTANEASGSKFFNKQFVESDSNYESAMEYTTENTVRKDLVEIEEVSEEEDIEYHGRVKTKKNYGSQVGSSHTNSELGSQDGSDIEYKGRIKVKKSSRAGSELGLDDIEYKGRVKGRRINSIHSKVSNSDTGEYIGKIKAIRKVEYNGKVLSKRNSIQSNGTSSVKNSSKDEDSKPNSIDGTEYIGSVKTKVKN
ncbi:Iron-sulfur assembly protein 1 [Lobulomyces angularis]|nr:Iron-sulfur assembly protein 1 [Lobulomyces angularis]